jgi:hypothetical protein
MKKQPKHGAVERLLGTERLRLADIRAQDEDMDQLSEVLAASSTLLNYYGRRVCEHEKADFNLPLALSELLNQQVESMKAIGERSKKLTQPPAAVVPEARVQFSSARKSKTGGAQ